VYTLIIFNLLYNTNDLGKVAGPQSVTSEFKFNVIASFPSFRSLWSLEEIIAILYLSLLVVQLQEFQAFKELYLPHTFMLCHKFDAYNGRINQSLQSRMNDIYNHIHVPSTIWQSDKTYIAQKQTVIISHSIFHFCLKEFQ